MGLAFSQLQHLDSFYETLLLLLVQVLCALQLIDTGVTGRGVSRLLVLRSG